MASMYASMADWAVVKKLPVVALSAIPLLATVLARDQIVSKLLAVYYFAAIPPCLAYRMISL